MHPPQGTFAEQTASNAVQPRPSLSKSEPPGRLTGRTKPQADARIRTGDPFITSEVLYQLSYVGDAAKDNRRRSAPAAGQRL